MFRFLRVTVSDITERAHLAMDGPSLDIRPLFFTLALSHLSGMIPKKARKVIEGKEPVHVPDVGREEGNEEGKPVHHRPHYEVSLVTEAQGEDRTSPRGREVVAALGERLIDSFPLEVADDPVLQPPDLNAQTDSLYQQVSEHLLVPFQQVRLWQHADRMQLRDLEAVDSVVLPLALHDPG